MCNPLALARTSNFQDRPWTDPTFTSSGRPPMMRCTGNWKRRIRICIPHITSGEICNWLNVIFVVCQVCFVFLAKKVTVKVDNQQESFLLETFILIMLPYTVKTQYVHFRSHAEYFLLPWKIPDEISRRSVLFHSEAASIISNIMYMQPFRVEVYWPEIWHLMEVSIMFYICIILGCFYYVGQNG